MAAVGPADGAAGLSTDGADSGVTVTAEGSASAVPDVLVVDVAAEAVSAAPGTAFAEATAGLRSVVAAARDLGVADGDLRSGEMSLWTEHDREGRPAGYRAALRLEVRLRDVATAGEALGLLLAAAGDTARLSGTRFEHSDPAALAAAARDAAFAEARTRASRYADLAGRRLGAVVAVVEGGGRPGPRPMARLAAADAAAVAPVEAGTLAVTASVTVTWAWG